MRDMQTAAPKPVGVYKPVVLSDNCSPGFTEHPAVINGFRELMTDVFGRDNGIGARSAVGMGSLPGSISDNDA